MKLQEYIKRAEDLKKEIQDCDNLISLYQDKKKNLQKAYEEMQKVELTTISDVKIENMRKVINTCYMLIKDIFKKDNINLHMACAPEDAGKYMAFVIDINNFEKLKELTDNMYKYVDINLLKEEEQ